MQFKGNIMLKDVTSNIGVKLPLQFPWFFVLQMIESYLRRGTNSSHWIAHKFGDYMVILANDV
jgi:hypothetical protein